MLSACMRVNCAKQRNTDRRARIARRWKRQSERHGTSLFRGAKYSGHLRKNRKNLRVAAKWAGVHVETLARAEKGALAGHDGN